MNPIIIAIILLNRIISPRKITESLGRAEALRQSILKKAFEGNLLSTQEIEKCKSAPDYEPAAVLLEKIKMKQ